MKKEDTITLNGEEVDWILNQLAIHFFVKECRDVSRYLSAKFRMKDGREGKEIKK